MENRADYLIESLFANTLTGAEAQELKSLAATNPAVANEIAFQRRIAAAVAPLSLSHSIQNPVWKEAAQKPFPAAIKVTMWPR